MTDSVAIALINTVGIIIAAAIGYKKLHKIEKATDGLLSAQKKRGDDAEELAPGITHVPPGSTVKTTLAVNNPNEATDLLIKTSKKTENFGEPK